MNYSAVEYVPEMASGKRGREAVASRPFTSWET